MPIVTVAQRVELPASQVWDHISWHGVAKLEGGLFKTIVFFGETPEIGITKRLHLAEGLPVTERLEAFDADQRSYRYRVIDDGPLPVTDYRGYVRVTPCGPAACHVKIECDFTPVSVTAAQWAETWTAMELSLIEEIRTAILA